MAQPRDQEDPDRPGYLFVLPWFPESPIGGVNQAILHLIRLMKLDGRYQPLLLISNGHRIPASSPHLRCPAFSLEVRNPAATGWKACRAFLAFCFHLPATLRTLRALVKTHDLRVINCVFPETECLSFVLLKRLGLFPGKVILVLQGNDIKLALDNTGFSRFLARLMFRGADRVVACSEGIRQDLLRLERRADSVVIRNAIDAEALQTEADWEYRLPERLRTTPYLLNVGRFEHKKGQDVLVKAFQQIADRFPDLLLVMIGASVGDESASIREIVHQSGLEHRIVMLENVPHERIPVFLKAARVFVLPSRREGLPFAILEAGVCGAPVVGAACVGVPEVIQDHVTGRLVPVDDAKALGEAISDLLYDEAESRRLAKNLHRLIIENFTWKRAYEQYIHL